MWESACHPLAAVGSPLLVDCFVPTQASFCGADFGPGAGAHYTIAHLKEMGAAFVPALLEFTDPVQVHE